MVPYPKRLIEVDLPIREISAHARREKSIRHGHISTLHIWWARRPLAACRAVLCASLWPDPVDDACPQGFRDAAAVAICYFADQVQRDEKLAVLCKNHWARWIRTNPTTLRSSDPACWAEMRYALLDFIADFANWDSSISPAFLDTARLLTQAAHLVLQGYEYQFILRKSNSISETFHKVSSEVQNFPRPLVVDSFAGGGSIPLEALRVGADTFASDLNPIPVLLNKVLLEYIPRVTNSIIKGKNEAGINLEFQGLKEAIGFWGDVVGRQAEQELRPIYESEISEAFPIAYLWARKIHCEGPGCGAEIPLLHSLWIAKKGNRSVAVRFTLDKVHKKIGFEIIEKKAGKWYRQCDLNRGPHLGDVSIEIKSLDGTVKRGSVTCPLCGYTTPVNHVREQLKQERGGTHSAILYAVILNHKKEGTIYKTPSVIDHQNIIRAQIRLNELVTGPNAITLPREPTPLNKSHRAVGSPSIYGMETWADLFNIRQLVALLTINRIIRDIPNDAISVEARIILGLCASKLSGFLSSLCMWRVTRTCVAQTFTRQALPQVWDFGEMNPFAKSAGDWNECIKYIQTLIDTIQRSVQSPGTVELANAVNHPLPDDAAQIFFTDPPYYDSVAYAELSDFFYVWLKRSIGSSIDTLFHNSLTSKDDQIIVLHPDSVIEKNSFERRMTLALSEGRRVLQPSGMGIVVFAHKSTTGWEAQIQALIDAGWVITGSWPIDTERGGRMNAQDTASLASSIHLICRPRETTRGEMINEIGDWRDVLNELPERIHSWLPRLANEGIVGADAIFACLGPALEIFSRYSHVEKASGEVVTLKEYLEVVWAAVSREAMSVIFEGADASGFEEDARLTAMWLWTLSGNKPENQPNGNDNAETEEADEETSAKTNGSGSHYVLEYDTARKIAQGLGAHLERLNSLVELKGDQARLLSVSERAGSLFGREENPLQDVRKKAASSQLSLFSLMVTADGSSAEDEWQENRIQVGQTTLDQIHQGMLLFGAGRSTALKRFLVDDGIGKAERFWRLAQALSALYPSGSEEKRWVDGVLAKKKGLGF